MKLFSTCYDCTNSFLKSDIQNTGSFFELHLVNWDRPSTNAPCLWWWPPQLVMQNFQGPVFRDLASILIHSIKQGQTTMLLAQMTQITLHYSF